METALALVHSRFSTNTFPSWDRSHPYRYIAHNGEINTLRGNINWMKAREALFDTDAFGEDVKKILPIVNPNGSDSAMFDNTLELLVLAGRSLPHAVMMMIPEPWSNHENMDDSLRAFYEYHSSLMEPWDGPACIAFTDGRKIGAVLDRNGLRPSRYYVTKDDMVVMASEAGVLDVPPENVLSKGRLQPGRMFLVDTEAGRIVEDEEIKRQVASERPYRQWLDEHLMRLEDLPAAPEVPVPDHDTLVQRQIAFGYTFEDQRVLLDAHGQERRRGGRFHGQRCRARGAVIQAAAAVRLLQAAVRAGDQPADRLHPRGAHHRLRGVAGFGGESADAAAGGLPAPGAATARSSPTRSSRSLRRLHAPGLKVGVLSILFRATRGERGLVKSIEELRLAARRMVEDEEVNILVLSDRGVNREFAAVPSLLAVSALHHYLIREGLRTRVSLVLETGEAREVHHFSLLIGYGCSAINPYLAFETLDGMIRDEFLQDIDHAKACNNFAKAATKGVIKVMSKMGISAVQSYHGAQVFEAVGLRQDVIDEYFTWTSSRIGGIGMDVIAQEIMMRHRAAFPARGTHADALTAGGQYQWRNDGETHLFSPEAIHRLQKAVRTGSFATYKSYAQLIDDQSTNLCTLRGLLGIQERGCDSDRGSRIGGDPRQALQDRRHVLWLDQQGGARDAGHRHEPHRRQEQHR